MRTAKKTTSSSERGTLIAAGTRIRGRLTGRESLIVHGRIDGEIELSESLLVEPSGVVCATARVRDARVAGAVVGDIEALERVHLLPSARVLGNIVAPAVKVDPGAQWAGKSQVEGIESRKTELRPAARTVVEEAWTLRPRPGAEAPVATEARTEIHPAERPRLFPASDEPEPSQGPRKRLVVKVRRRGGLSE